MKRKSTGFTGQRIIQIPREITEKCRQLPLVSMLFITKMGVYPKALNHYYSRPKGISQAILLYCTDGAGWVQLQKVKVNISAGDVFIIPRGVPHSYGSNAQTPWTIYWMHLSGLNCDEAVRSVMENKALPDKAVHVGSGEMRIPVFDQIEQAFLRGYSLGNLMFANLSVPYFLSSFITPGYFNRVDLVGEPESYTAKAIAFMQNNLARPNNLKEIAGSAHLSVSFFSRYFKKETGYSPVEYFNHLKIQKACQLLHLTSLRINEVAAKIGIDDPLYFSRLFKKVMGISPVNYRKAETDLEK